MKRKVTFILISVLLFTLLGCQSERHSQWLSYADFYYPRIKIEYDREDGVISSEQRKTTAGWQDLAQLLPLYLNGPSDSRLYSPFPADLQIESVITVQNTIVLTFNSAFSKLKGYSRSIACTSIALTCLNFTGAKSVVIQYKINRAITDKVTELSLDQIHQMDLTPISTDGGIK